MAAWFPFVFIFLAALVAIASRAIGRKIGKRIVARDKARRIIAELERDGILTIVKEG